LDKGEQKDGPKMRRIRKGTVVVNLGPLGIRMRKRREETVREAEIDPGAQRETPLREKRERGKKRS